MTRDLLLGFTNEFFICLTNTKLSSISLPWLYPVKKYKRQLYAHEWDATIAKFRFDIANIGNKYPRIGRFSTTLMCPLCPTNKRNTVAHLSMFCPSIEMIRKEQSTITSFRNTCLLKGYSEDLTFALYINGQDWNQNPVELSDFLHRGVELKLLMDVWLSKW